MKENKSVQEIKEFDAVKFMREQRDRIATEILNLSTSEIIEYFDSNLPKERVKPLIIRGFNIFFKKKIILYSLLVSIMTPHY